MTVTPTPSPSSTRTTAVVVVIIAFVAGLFVGIAGDRLYFHRMFPGRRDFGSSRIVERLNRELHLTADQKSQVQKIVDSHRTRIESIMTPVAKLELQSRVEILLRARRVSLDLKLRNEDLEAFIQAMSHDLRASVRAVTMFAEAVTINLAGMAGHCESP